MLANSTKSNPIANSTSADRTKAELAATKRNKTRAVLRRLLAKQNLCKIGLAEGIGWAKLTEILFPFLDFAKIHAYILNGSRPPRLA